jgi:hypothetical protein
MIKEEYYCMNCGKEQNEIAYPNCGSNAKFWELLTVMCNLIPLFLRASIG